VDQKGIDLLLAAYAKIAKKAKYPLVIAGHGADQQKVEQLIHDYKLEDKVKMIGSTFGQKKLDVLSKAAFVAFSSRYDDLPIFGLEALAAGLPIACFDIPELKFITNEYGFKAKPFDTDDYAKTLLSAMENPNLPKMYDKCRAFAKQFSWDNTADQFEAFFYEILDKKKPQKGLR
jgi:glycosyltransferase involved in cell wall biosynthesis